MGADLGRMKKASAHQISKKENHTPRPVDEDLLTQIDVFVHLRPFSFQVDESQQKGDRADQADKKTDRRTDHGNVLMICVETKQTKLISQKTYYKRESNDNNF